MISIIILSIIYTVTILVLVSRYIDHRLTMSLHRIRFKLHDIFVNINTEDYNSFIKLRRNINDFIKHKNEISTWKSLVATFFNSSKDMDGDIIIVPSNDSKEISKIELEFVVLSALSVFNSWYVLLILLIIIPFGLIIIIPIVLSLGINNFIIRIQNFIIRRISYFFYHNDHKLLAN